MTAARARERGLVDLGAEAGRSWPIIWETFGKLRPSSAERTQGNTVRVAMERSGHHLERTHWKLWENSGSTWMRHGVDSHETLGKLGLPWSGDLLAGGKLAKTLWELVSIHDRCTCKGTLFVRPGGRVCPSKPARGSAAKHNHQPRKCKNVPSPLRLDTLPRGWLPDAVTTSGSRPAMHRDTMALEVRALS